MPLTRVGRYRLADELGVGMFSRVVVGVDDETGLSYAVKVMNKRRLEELNMDQYARREAVVLHRVKHPNICEFVEAIQSAKKLFLVMQIAPGTELLDVVLDGAMSECDARIYCMQLVNAIACLHENGYAHRDIKPSNVLIDPAQRKLTVIDLGLAGIIKKYSPMSTLCGSDFYKAPEIFLGNSSYDGVKCDAWSVGILAYILLTGTHPFIDSGGQLMVEHLRNPRRELDLPKHLSSSAVSFVSCLLSLNPKKRSSIAEIKNHTWLNPGINNTGTTAYTNMNMHYPKGPTTSSLSRKNYSRRRPSSGVARMFSRSNIHNMTDNSANGAANEKRESYLGDRRRLSKSTSSTSSFLWFRKNLNTDEYGHEESFGTRSYLPKLGREIPLRRGSYAVNGMGSMSGNLNCEDMDGEKRERSMSFLGKAVHSLAFKVNNSDRNGTPERKNTLPSRAPDVHTQARNNSGLGDPNANNGNTNHHTNVEEALHDLNEARKYMDDRRKMPDATHTYNPQHGTTFHDIQSEKIEGRKGDMGAKLARQFSAVFRKTKLIIQSNSSG